MKEKLILVTLNAEQVEKAKEVNGKRKQITHALICGSHGQIFGTKKHCDKYFSAWKEIFKDLFNQSIEVDDYEISDFESTFDMVNILIDIQDTSKEKNKIKIDPAKKKSLFSKLFGK